MKDLIQKLIISIAGVLFMAGFTLLFPDPSIWHYFSLLLFLLIAYYLILPLLKTIWTRATRLFRSYFPKIGVLNGNIINPIREHKCEREWTNVTPSMWDLILRKEITKRTELITTSEINNSYSIIINPFGDVFPEQDTKLHKTFYSICEFVKNGGIFIVTGGAFFSHQNTIHSVKHEWVFTKTTEGLQSLKDSFLFLEFGIQTTGDQYQNGQRVLQEPIEIEIYQKPVDKYYMGEMVLPSKIKRFRASTSETSNYIPFVREKDDKSYPIVAVRYGKGFLIHAGVFLESEASAEFRMIINVISNLVKKRFKNL
jgi:hypothetical protein